MVLIKTGILQDFPSNLSNQVSVPYHRPTMNPHFLSLPVELIAEILSELDLESLVRTAYLSRRLQQVAADAALNPWRRPILRALTLDSTFGTSDPCLKNLSVRTVVPRQNWIEVMSLARPEFVLFEATLPNLREAEWEECFRRRFLPGWTKWRRDGRWKEVFLKILFRVWHRSHTSCTAEEAWTKYIVLNRNGSANELQGWSRTFNPLTLFNEMKLQSNLAHLETQVRCVVQLQDVRILALGVLNKPRTNFTVNANARALLHPPALDGSSPSSSHDAYRTDSSLPTSSFSPHAVHHGATYPYSRLTHPVLSPSHSQYPFYTPGGGDKRWFGSGELEEDGREWVGGLLLVAQLVGKNANGPWLTSTKRTDDEDDWGSQGMVLLNGPGRSQYASFSWVDFWAIAPWMEDRVTKRIDGPGLGLG